MSALEHIVARVSAEEPFFLGYWFRGMTDDEIRRRLNCWRDDLTPLRLCRRPETPEDHARIEEHFGLRAGSLRELIAR